MRLRVGQGLLAARWTSKSITSGPAWEYCENVQYLQQVRYEYLYDVASLCPLAQAEEKKDDRTTAFDWLRNALVGQRPSGFLIYRDLEPVPGEIEILMYRRR